MKIEQEYQINKKETNSTKKTLTIILILITFSFLIVVGIVVLMATLKDDKLIVTIDGQDVSTPEDTFLFAEATGETYISIKDIATFVGYEPHNGEYKVNSEDTNKMYIESKDGTETTSFYLNSTLICKVAPNSTDDYENIELKSPVTMINNKWYINAEGFMQAFNLIFNYDKTSNKITIQTLPYLVSYYEEHITDFGYDALSKDFNNNKAIVYGMLVASKKSTGRYGVINVRTGSEVISPRYKDIKFIESSLEFIITNTSDKVGIAYATGDTKINVFYDEIKVFDSSLGYYLVKSNSKYGVINSSEELVIHIEYDNIGIDTTKFPADNLKSQYVLYETLIPVRLNSKWGLFDIEGKKVTDVEYDAIGCINDKLKERTVNNTIIIGDTEVIILSKDGKYGGISTRGDMLIPNMFEYIFSITSGGETKYWLHYNELDYNAIEYITAMKTKLGYSEANTSNENNNETSNNEGSNENNLNQTNNQEEGQNPENPSNEVQDQTGENGENSNADPVKEYNLKFEPYAGEHSRGAVRSLLDVISETNLTHENKIQVDFEGSSYISNISELKQQIVNSIYNISIEHNADTGYVEKIGISS